MKKIVASIALLLGALNLAMAVPAAPGSHRYTQPDGTVIVLTNHGDEYYHWTTDESGTIVEKGDDGFYRPSTKTAAQRRKAMARAAEEHRSRWSSYDNPPETNFGDRKVLVVLVNFSDSTFVIDDPRTRFHNLLNQAGYSENGGCGSVRDYYLENSFNQYRPSFDVYGPVNLTQSSKYYDDNGARIALYEACEQLDSQINFADYDTDNNGTVDMILFYYPGHNEAEGASSESIWPHQSRGYGNFDGVEIGSYFCTSELRGERGTNMCGIGTTTHEFAHSLGLPDFYDTDYEDNGGVSNGETGWYDVMSSGPYLNDGRRPPYFSAMERNMLGWMPEPEFLNASGSFTLEAVQNNKAWKLNTANEGEYFILECRNGEGWDASLPDRGLAIYHVDQSENIVAGSSTAAYLWENTNKINAFYPHPCYYIMTNSGDRPTSRQYKDMLFGGKSEATSISLRDWAGNDVGLSLSEITLSSGKISFNASYSSPRTLMGKVTDTDGEPLSGVTVVLSKPAYPFNAAPSILPSDLVATTASDGTYSFTLEEDLPGEQILIFRKEGYVTLSQNINLKARTQHRKAVLFRLGEGPAVELCKVNKNETIYQGYVGTEEQAVSMCYTAEEIASQGYAGSALKTIIFAVGEFTYTKAYAVVFFGTERVLAKELESVYFNAYNYVDISSAGLVIPEGKDVYIGVGCTGLVSGEYPFYMRPASGPDTGGSYKLSNFLSNSNWVKTNFGGSYYDFEIFADIEMPGDDPDLAAFDIAYIRLEAGVPVAVPSAGKTLKDCTWYLDGVAKDTPPAVGSLPAGAHTYKAVLRYYDGTTETLWYDVR